MSTGCSAKKKVTTTVSSVSPTDDESETVCTSDNSRVRRGLCGPNYKQSKKQTKKPKKQAKTNSKQVKKKTKTDSKNKRTSTIKDAEKKKNYEATFWKKAEKPYEQAHTDHYQERMRTTYKVHTLAKQLFSGLNFEQVFVFGANFQNVEGRVSENVKSLGDRLIDSKE